MGWVTIKEYTKDCGCECQDNELDVDRPFMCYTKWETIVTKRCENIYKSITKIVRERKSEKNANDKSEKNSYNR